MGWYLSVLKKYAVFEGRARRKEYWYFVLFNILITAAISISETLFGLIVLGTDINFLTGLYELAVFIPSVAVGARRLHDIDRSGWWQLIVLIPLIGWIILIYFLASESQPGQNQYG